MFRRNSQTPLGRDSSQMVSSSDGFQFNHHIENDTKEQVVAIYGTAGESYSFQGTTSYLCSKLSRYVWAATNGLPSLELQNCFYPCFTTNTWELFPSLMQEPHCGSCILRYEGATLFLCFTLTSRMKLVQWLEEEPSPTIPCSIALAGNVYLYTTS